MALNTPTKNYLPVWWEFGSQLILLLTTSNRNGRTRPTSDSPLTTRNRMQRKAGKWRLKKKTKKMMKRREREMKTRMTIDPSNDTYLGIITKNCQYELSQPTPPHYKSFVIKLLFISHKI